MAPEPLCLASASNLFGGSPEDVSHSSSVTQPLVQHRDDAHEQSVTHTLDPVVLICDRAETEVSDWVGDSAAVSQSELIMTAAQAKEKERAAVLALHCITVNLKIMKTITYICIYVCTCTCICIL